MAKTKTFTKLKDFNPTQLMLEVATLGLPEHTTWFIGFE